jgi:DEAD/DEAH box helicase domain-containing protein
VEKDVDLGRKKPWTPGSPGKKFSKEPFDEIYSTILAGREAKNAPFPPSVAPGVAKLLTQDGKRTPYIHQAEVAHLTLDEGKNVSLIVPTAAGKTVAFLAPALTMLVKDPEATVMMAYPLNALAVDQLKVLKELGFAPLEGSPRLLEAKIDGVSIIAGVMNGDSSVEERKRIRKDARLILTNPPALHAAILPMGKTSYQDDSSWRRIFQNLKLLVIDEGHIQSGVTGTNTGGALSRLFALSEACGGVKPPQVIIATATVKNPIEHAEQLTGLKNWQLVDRNGAKAHRKSFRVVMPQEVVKKNDETGKWEPIGELYHPNYVAKRIAVEEAMANGNKVLVFVNSRNGAERMAASINEEANKKFPRECKGNIAIAFHSGIPGEQKTALLGEILAGKHQVIVSSSALEAGVELPDMQVCVQIGHPADFSEGGQASFMQRAGRAGRTTEGLVYLIVSPDLGAYNNYMTKNPYVLFADPESRSIYRKNEKLMTAHAACCYLETGRNMAVVQKFFPSVNPDRVIEASENSPHNSIGMLGALGNFGQFTALTPDGSKIQELGGADALLNWHPGAIIRNVVTGRAYEVLDLDVRGQRAETKDLGEGCKDYTMPKRESKHLIIAREDANGICEGVRGFEGAFVADFYVSEQTIGYTRMAAAKHGPPERKYFPMLEEERNPVVAYQTRGFEFQIDPESPIGKLVTMPNAASDAQIKACNDARQLLTDGLSKTLPVIVQARPGDIRLAWAEDGLPVLTVYDKADGGMGWSEAAGLRMPEWLKHASTLFSNCGCHGVGCPNCSLAGGELDLREDLQYAINKSV